MYIEVKVINKQQSKFCYNCVDFITTNSGTIIIKGT